MAKIWWLRGHGPATGSSMVSSGCEKAHWPPWAALSTTCRLRSPVDWKRHAGNLRNRGIGFRPDEATDGEPRL